MSKAVGRDGDSRHGIVERKDVVITGPGQVISQLRVCAGIR
jgi:hypothetical protein